MAVSDERQPEASKLLIFLGISRDSSLGTHIHVEPLEVSAFHCPSPCPHPAWHLPADTGYSWAEGRSVRWGVVVGCRVPGCSRRSSRSCRQVVVEAEVVGLYSPGCNLPGCRAAGCNSAGKWGGGYN